MKNSDGILYTLISILSDGNFHSLKSLERYFNIKQKEIISYIKILLESGIDIFYINGKGCSLLEPIQLLNKQFIQKKINKGSVNVFPVVDSTNQYFLDHLSTLHSGDVCIAEYQKLGRGRYGRKWFSPFGSNLYLSIYWKFKQAPVEIIGLNLVVSTVIAEILYEFGVENIKLKQPNDLYLLNRKLAGVLIELRSKLGNITQTVIGIGINLAMRSVLKEKIHPNWINLKEIGITVDRNIFAIQLVNKLRFFLEFFEKEGLSSFLSRQKNFKRFI